MEELDLSKVLNLKENANLTILNDYFIIKLGPKMINFENIIIITLKYFNLNIFSLFNNHLKFLS